MGVGLVVRTQGSYCGTSRVASVKAEDGPRGQMPGIFT
jgi:hypothetical protein